MTKISILLFLLILCSCRNSISKLLKSGDVKQENFFEVISFELEGTLPIVVVEINGEKATCLFDTGAPNVISPELASKLNLQAKTSADVRDSGGNKEVQEYVLIDSISMGGVVFRDLAAVVVNLEANVAIRCLEIDGIIGANLMRQAYWEMDYQNQNLTFTDDISRLSDTAGMKILNFYPDASGTPKVAIDVNGHIVKNVTFDTGSNGHITLPKKEIKKKLSDSFDEKKIAVVGSSSYGVYGLAKSDTSYFRRIDSVNVAGGLDLESPIIQFRGSARLFGSKVLKNYKLILDWNDNNVYLDEVSPYRRDSLSNFGFSFLLKENQLYVGSIVLETEAAKSLKIDDQILSINGDSFEGIPEETYCPMLLNKMLLKKYEDKLKMKIKRGEEIFEIELKKKNHFN